MVHYECLPVRAEEALGPFAGCHSVHPDRRSGHWPYRDRTENDLEQIAIQIAKQIDWSRSIKSFFKSF